MPFTPDRGVSPYDNFDRLKIAFPLKTQDLSNGIVTVDKFATLPQARVRNSAAQAVGNAGSGTALTFDTETYDLVPSGLTEQHSTSSNTSRLTCRVAGLYGIGGSFQWATSSIANAYRQIGVRLNGSTFLAAEKHVTAIATVDDFQAITTEYRLVVGDFVELIAFHNTGSNLNVVASSPWSPSFWFSWRSP